MSAPLKAPPRDLEEILDIESALRFRSFTAETAWQIGSSLRQRIQALSSKPAVINITLANSNQLLFHACTRSGVQPDNDLWVSRKRRTVLRWGTSTWYMHNKFAGDEVAFAAKYGLGGDAGSYAIHGGGFPVTVEGVEGVVGVIVVSGLKQDEDHGVIVETVQAFLQSRN